MAEKHPRPPYEFEPSDRTDGKYRSATVLVAIFIVILLAVAIFVVATQPAAPDITVNDVPTQAPASD